MKTEHYEVKVKNRKWTKNAVARDKAYQATALAVAIPTAVAVAGLVAVVVIKWLLLTTQKFL